MAVKKYNKVKKTLKRHGYLSKYNNMNMTNALLYQILIELRAIRRREMSEEEE